MASIEDFKQNLEQNLAEIQRLLKENRYNPSPVKRVLIPKHNGKMRQLGAYITSRLWPPDDIHKK